MLKHVEHLGFNMLPVVFLDEQLKVFHSIFAKCSTKLGVRKLSIFYRWPSGLLTNYFVVLPSITNLLKRIGIKRSLKRGFTFMFPVEVPSLLVLGNARKNTALLEFNKYLIPSIAFLNPSLDFRHALITYPLFFNTFNLLYKLSVHFHIFFSYYRAFLSTANKFSNLKVIDFWEKHLKEKSRAIVFRIKNTRFRHLLAQSTYLLKKNKPFNKMFDNFFFKYPPEIYSEREKKRIFLFNRNSLKVSSNFRAFIEIKKKKRKVTNKYLKVYRDFLVIRKVLRIKKLTPYLLKLKKIRSILFIEKKKLVTKKFVVKKEKSKRAKAFLRQFRKFQKDFFKGLSEKTRLLLLRLLKAKRILKKKRKVLANTRKKRLFAIKKPVKKIRVKPISKTLKKKKVFVKFKKKRPVPFKGYIKNKYKLSFV